MKSLLLRSSIARRLLVTIVIAFLITWVKNVAVFYYEEVERDRDNTEAGAIFASELRRISHQSEAVRATRTLQDRLNAMYPGGSPARKNAPRVFIQLGTVSGEVLYESEALGHLLHGTEGRVVPVTVNGRDFKLASFNEGPWAFRLGIPVFKRFAVLANIFENMAPFMLISFPIVMIPLWIGIRAWLKPLDRLSKALAARRDDDLSPLAIDMKYAELEGVVDAFENLLGRLRRKMESERDFMQDAAHELRTPLAVISAQGHVLAHADNGPGREQAEKALEQAISRASHLSEQLLSLASLDHSRYRDKVSLDVVPILQNLLAGMTPTAMSRKVEIALEAPESLVMPMNRVAFHSIVQNLLDNALRYGVEGGRILITLAERDEDVELCVADDGPGIPEAEREHVFDRFFRGREQNATGTGLGLAIVDRATRAMGGCVRMDIGLDGRGVAFVMVFARALPIAK